MKFVGIKLWLLTLEILSLLVIIQSECPPPSPHLGRCGPSWGGRCNKELVDYAVYCNVENGWCGVTYEHQHAQEGDTYDWEPESCQRKFSYMP